MPGGALANCLVYFSGANLLANFGVAVTYETFITLGLILAVPACAGNNLWLFVPYKKGCCHILDRENGDGEVSSSLLVYGWQEKTDTMYNAHSFYRLKGW